MPFNLDNEWKPNRAQARFLSIPFNVREALYGGGAGSGKSELLLMLCIVYGFYLNPKFKQLFLRRTSKQIRKEVWPRSFEIYPKFGAVANEQELIWTFPRDEGEFGGNGKRTGAKVYFGHCENENDVHIYDSMEINLFTPDEITSLTYFIHSYIGFTRVRTSDPALPAIIRGAGMPGDVGHSWVKKRFIDPYPKGGKRILGKGGNSRIYIHATQADNPNIDPNYKQSLEGLPEAEKQAKLYGSWDAYLGQVFEEFRDKNYPDEPENAMHICKAFDIPSWWPKLCAIDWGYAAMCSVGWGAISPDQKLYVYRHQTFIKKKIEEWAPEVKFYVDKDNPVDIIICHSANQHRGDPHTILEQVSSALECSVTLGEKNRLAGKALLHEYLRWEQKVIPQREKGIYDPDLAASILRNRSRKEYEDYVNSFTHQNQKENIPRLQFFGHYQKQEVAGEMIETLVPLPDIKLICDSIKACVYEKESNDGKKKEDVAEFNGDDPYDMLRMLLHSADKFFNLATDKAEELSKTNEIVRRLEETGDMTGYYRQMRMLESKNYEQPVMRFHRGNHRYH